MKKKQGKAARYGQAQRHLARRDAVLRRLIAELGPCTLIPDPKRFPLLVRAIISQQISGKAARSISGRLAEALGKPGFTPRALLRLSDEAFRLSGVSTAKVRYLRDLADKVHTGAVPLDDLHDAADEEVIERLLPVKGIGRWTAEMFLIFSLGRLDVLPVLDFGLREGVRRHYRLRKHPDRERLTKLTEPWRPYRTVGTWYMWRSLGGVPQSE